MIVSSQVKSLVQHLGEVIFTDCRADDTTSGERYAWMEDIWTWRPTVLPKKHNNKRSTHCLNEDLVCTRSCHNKSYQILMKNDTSLRWDATMYWWAVTNWQCPLACFILHIYRVSWFIFKQMTKLTHSLRFDESIEISSRSELSRLIDLFVRKMWAAGSPSNLVAFPPLTTLISKAAPLSSGCFNSGNT